MAEFSERSAPQPSANHQILNGVELPSVRSLDDFILEKSRFDIPPYNDLQKWNNRIVSNLMYYQTNYFICFLVLFIIQSLFHSEDLVYGLTAIIAVGSVIIFAVSSDERFYKTRREHPMVTLGAIVLSFYYFISVISSVLIVVFSILMPLFIILCHASCRLRNFSNKLTQATERLGLRTTVMGRLLDICGISAKA